MSTFLALWPIHDPDHVTTAQALDHARADLPAVARRHHVTLLGAPHFRIVEGRLVPGSGGAPYAVIATAPAEKRPRAAK